MSNKSLVSLFGASSPFGQVIDTLARSDAQYPDLKTFFGKYRNPIGIEVEVENIHDRIKWPQKASMFWRCEPDGSLRNGGVEFISVALSGRMIDHAIKEVSEALANYKPDWSVRTSIHVHVNMSTYTFNQLKALCMLYVLFEDCFYAMCAPHRKGNSFCYPVASIDPKEFSEINDQNKYCALNLAPLRKQTTIEFRHLQGTDDWRLVRRWIQMIVKLHYFCEKMESCTAVNEVIRQIHRGEFYGLFKTIFGATTQLFSENQITDSAKKNSDYAVVLSEWRFN